MLLAKLSSRWSHAAGERQTRTISLGICTVCAHILLDLRTALSTSDREEPLFTGANGTLMARAVPCGHRFLANQLVAAVACLQPIAARPPEGDGTVNRTAQRRHDALAWQRLRARGAGAEGPGHRIMTG
jgi:hypothetical protein